MTSRRAFIAAAAVSTAAACFADRARAAVDGSLKAGVQYRLLENPQAPTVASGKVEVIEVFWYGCAHCFALDPVLEEWNTKKASYIEFLRVPVIWSGVPRQHAKIYYTLQALHRPDLHAKVFSAIHTEGVPLTAKEDGQARALQLGFFTQQGVTEQQFNGAYDSMMVAMNMQRAENYTRALQITNVPSLFINGKFATSVGEAGGESQLIQLIDSLAASEHH